MTGTRESEVLKAIRKEFFALRNGMIADTLRKAGLEQKYIFGLQLPQIKGIADKFRPDVEEKAAELSRALWSNRECREARLLACHLMPPRLMTEDEMSGWAKDVISREEADILAFRLLRYVPESRQLALSIIGSDKPLERYTAEAILRFF